MFPEPGRQQEGVKAERGGLQRDRWKQRDRESEAQSQHLPFRLKPCFPAVALLGWLCPRGIWRFSLLGGREQESKRRPGLLLSNFQCTGQPASGNPPATMSVLRKRSPASETPPLEALLGLPHLLPQYPFPFSPGITGGWGGLSRWASPGQFRDGARIRCCGSCITLAEALSSVLWVGLRAAPNAG